MEVTRQQLRSLYQSTRVVVIDKYLDSLNLAMQKFDINTPDRIAMFLAQVGHESGGLTIVEENLNYRAERLVAVFPKYFRDVDVNDYAMQPEKIANRVYANRMGNGNEDSSDGYKYRGRGFIQLTGHDNYAHFAEAMEMSVDDAVDYLETPEGACMSAGWFWSVNNINQYADRQDCRGATIRINGGTNGLLERESIYHEALELFD